MLALALLGMIAGATGAQAAAPRELQLASASGRFVAEVVKAAGQERVAEELARWRLSVFALDRDGKRTPSWSCLMRHRAGEQLHWLTDDGLAFVELDPRRSGKRELVRVWRDEKELVALDDDALGIGREADLWLSRETGARVGWLATPVGPTAQLLIELPDGGQRRVDLETGLVYPTHDWVDELEIGPIVEEDLRDAAQSPYVRSATGPARVHWGERLEIAIAGSHPTPNWRSVGIEARTEGEHGARIVLTPLSAPPPSNSVQVQVLERFETSAWIDGLRPGRYTVQVLGRGDEQVPPIAIEVLPARALLELATSGGIMGLDELVRVYRNGVVELNSKRRGPEPSYVVLDAQDRALIDAAFAELPKEPKSSRTPGAADMFMHVLRWQCDGRELAWSFDDGSASACGRELVRVLRETAVRGWR